jgi:hypothetical protein
MKRYEPNSLASLCERGRMLIRSDLLTVSAS